MDDNLSNFFGSKKLKKHLKKMMLIDKAGKLLETRYAEKKEVMHKLIKKVKKKNDFNFMDLSNIQETEREKKKKRKLHNQTANDDILLKKKDENNPLNISRQNKAKTNISYTETQVNLEKIEDAKGKTSKKKKKNKNKNSQNEENLSNLPKIKKIKDKLNMDEKYTPSKKKNKGHSFIFPKPPLGLPYLAYKPLDPHNESLLDSDLFHYYPKKKKPAGIRLAPIKKSTSHQGARQKNFLNNENEHRNSQNNLLSS